MDVTSYSASLLGLFNGRNTVVSKTSWNHFLCACMYVYIEMRARFSSIDRFVEKLFAWLVDRWKKRKEKGGTKRERGGEKKEKEKEERTKIKRLQCVVIGHWLSLTKIRKARNLWNLKSEYFFFLLLEILNRSVNICFHSSVCILFSFLSFFFYPRRIYKKTSRFAKNFTFIYSFILSFLSTENYPIEGIFAKLSTEIVKTSLVKYPFHPFPLYFYRASHRKIILSLWRNGGKNDFCSLRSNLFEPFQPRSTTPSYYRDREGKPRRIFNES